MKDESSETLFGYWGKAAAPGEQPPRHPVVYHCLDVAAVGSVLLARWPGLNERFSRMLGLEREPAERWLLWLLAQHDIGKLAAAFQRLRPDLIPAPLSDRYRYDVRHDTLGYVLWYEKLLDDLAPWALGDVHLEEAFLTLLRASTGHHGRPPEDPQWRSTWFRPEDLRAATELSAAVSELFFGTVSPPEIHPADHAAFARRVAEGSWALAGFVVLCDWLGSNRTWFPFVDRAMSHRSYWEHYARPRALEAVRAAAVVPAAVGAPAGFAELFPHLVPTALQRAADGSGVVDGPRLHIIEDLTGSGKTEAALTLAAGLITSGEAHGLYVALPTTATADAMYERVGSVYRRLFAPDARPSLVLAHSRRDLSDKFVDSIDPGRVLREGQYHENERGAAATCAGWFADSRKKALLAQVGVGTIDQALLAALNVRHQTLRSFGLLGKVLVVDEVHACDAYMNGVLRQLLSLHAAMGGHAVLLSATLPCSVRAGLVASFAEGAGFEAPADLPSSFPQLASISADGVTSHPVEPPDWSRRALGFEIVNDVHAAAEWVVERAEDGACVCWVRNTVRDALQAYDGLVDRLGRERVTLFHARFAVCDRLRIEQRILGTFGSRSNHRARRGRVVVATQVVEQSLDVDFDEMVSDLAPLDLLLQRAGRLRRHPRNRRGDPLQDADQRGDPVLRVLSPEAEEDATADWVRSALPGTAHIYPHHGQLWRTARILAERRALRLPEDSRDAIESVFGEQAMDVPSALDTVVCRVDGEDRADASLAALNTIDRCSGYGGGWSSWTDHEDSRTRLGEATVTLRLARWHGHLLEPWAASGPHRWALSELSVPRTQVADTREPRDAALLKALRAAEGRTSGGVQWFVTLPLIEEGDQCWVGSVVDDEGKEGTVRYSKCRGFEVER